MPLYEYSCGACGHVTEARRNRSERNAPYSCARCRASVKRTISAPARRRPGGSGLSAAIEVAPVPNTQESGLRNLVLRGTTFTNGAIGILAPNTVQIDMEDSSFKNVGIAIERTD
jgi:putative FmdB family regulatory protein